MQEPIILIGAGGHAKACIDVIEQEGRFSIIGLVGQEHEVDSKILGYSVIGTDSDLPALFSKSKNAIVTIGQIKDPQPRMRLFESLNQNGFTLPNIISPIAYVSSHATIGVGTIVMHGAIVNAGANVERNCIINSKALIEHDVVINDHCHISTGVILNGAVHIGARTFIGSGSEIHQCVNIGEQCIIGMGQQVFADCETETRV